jgi:hypothetical protein
VDLQLATEVLELHQQSQEHLLLEQVEAAVPDFILVGHKA